MCTGMATQREIEILWNIVGAWQQTAFEQRRVSIIQARLRRHAVASRRISALRFSCIRIQCAFRCRLSRVAVVSSIITLCREEIEQHQTPRARRYERLLAYWRQQAGEQYRKKVLLISFLVEFDLVLSTLVL